ncbi:MAG TPA: hypothetical protein VFF06_20990 [Polyangia bacterium]|nr:hypothetical protein [Polyangia bacterium]
MELKLDVLNAFDGDPNKQVAIGGLVSLKIGTETIEKLLAKPCIETGKATGAVAVLSYFEWDGQPTGSMTMRGVVNDKGRAALERIKDAATQLDVTFGIKICRPDAKERKYYTAVDATTLKGILDKNRGKGAIDVDQEKDPDTHGGTEELFHFMLSVAPDVSSAQTAQYATEKGANQVKYWGQRA